MKKSVLCIFVAGLIMILFISSVSAISKENFRNFLKAELNKYFQGKSTLLEISELRKAIDFYFTVTGDEVDLTKSGLSQTSINILNTASLGLVDEFSCTLVATGKENYEEKGEVEKEGYKIKCCTKLIGWFLIAPSCVENTVKYTECMNIKRFRLGVSYDEGRAACKQSFGNEYTTAKIFLLGYARDAKKCTYDYTPVINKTADRVETDTISFTIDKGQTRQIPITMQIYSEHDGKISNVKYTIKCTDSRISARISEKIIYVTRS